MRNHIDCDGIGVTRVSILTVLALARNNIDGLAVRHASLRCAPHVSVMPCARLVDVLQACCQRIYTRRA
eukprot:7336319-Lingulodinium_polyedra.AAC.1